MNEPYPKFQYSQFDNLEGQFVVRAEDQAEFKELVKMVKLATGKVFAQASQNAKSAPQQGDKPKVPYMFEGDTCPACNKGLMQKTVKESKTGEKYNALVCDQQGCRGFAYLSKYPKFGATATPFPKEEIIQINPNDNDLPF